MKTIISSLLALWAINGFSQPTLDYYFPNHQSFDQSVPMPSQTLGFEVGEWHVRPDQLLNYARRLAADSPKAMVRSIGRSHEQRELVHLIISSPENLARLDEIQANQRSLVTTGKSPVSADKMPLIVWLCYSVHGNESSGSNASMLVAYRLLADPSLAPLLKQAVVVIDPSLNPDGLGRFAHWANMHRGQNLVANPVHREHREPWPNGRTNHYWFDLNRDWLLLQHPESIARVRQFHQWHPHLLGDFHEMGTQSTYFFQPGVPSRQNPLTPPDNLDLTRDLARHHARALDKKGVLYFSEQQFDDFYYGKGSTYPDGLGSVGILFEQSSSRGHIQKRSMGLITFPETIRNQMLTSFSTVEGGLALKGRLFEYQQSFAKRTLDEAGRDPIAGVVVDTESDPVRGYELLRLLRGHEVEVYALAEPLGKGEQQIRQGFVVPFDQYRYRMVKSLFGKDLTFKDSVFYDITTWNLGYGFGLPFKTIKRGNWRSDMLGKAIERVEMPNGSVRGEKQAYAYAIDWRHYSAPKFANALLEKGVKIRAATKPLKLVLTEGSHSFGEGALIIPAGVQDMAPDRLRAAIEKQAQANGLPVHALGTGLTKEGIDLGSPSFRTLKTPKPLLLVGPGINTYQAGAIWHLLDYRFGMKVSLGDTQRLRELNWSDYTHVILAGGAGFSWSDNQISDLKDWIRDGGVLVASGGASGWVGEQGLIKFEERKPKPANGNEQGNGETEPAPLYGNRSQDRAKERISGTIFEANIDVTHPLGYGLQDSKLAMFRRHNRFYQPTKEPYITAARYSDDPLLSGFVSPTNLEMIRNSAAVLANGYGRGSVVVLVDPPVFRGVWLGTHKLMLNAIFFGEFIETTSQ